MKGPYTAVENTPSRYVNRMWYRSTDKIRSPLPYTSVQCFRMKNSAGSLEAVSSWGLNQLSGYDGSMFAGLNFGIALNKAYAKMIGRIGENATMGTNLVEVGQSIKLLTHTFQMIRHPLQYIAARCNSKDGWGMILPDAWLALHFGVMPFMQDAYAACDIISSPLPDLQVYGGAKVSDNVNYTQGSGYRIQTGHFKLCGRVAATVKVSNPNLYLLNALGLANPVSVVLDAIPFSFVLDWWYDVGSFVRSMSDFYGLSVTDAYHTRYGVADTREYYPKDGSRIDATFHSVYLKRTLGMYKPIPKLKIKAPSLTRVATAASLAAELIDGIRKTENYRRLQAERKPRLLRVGKRWPWMLPEYAR